MTALDKDFRLADFKLLLPLRRDVRTLVIAVEDTRFLPHLADELGEIDIVQGDSLTRPEGLYPLVFSDSLDAACYLSPGGTLCHFAPAHAGKPTDLPDALTLIGSWRAFPSWPNFRVLIPDHPVGLARSNSRLAAATCALLAGRHCLPSSQRCGACAPAPRYRLVSTAKC
jgi:hypothetical protein